jgi:hypothetical protein
MPDRSIDHLAKITAKPAPRETGPEAKKIKAAEKAVAMGQVTDPEEISPSDMPASAASRICARLILRTACRPPPTPSCKL